MGITDAELLIEAHRERLTLVTYDVNTIPKILADFAIQAIDHSGVVFISRKTFALNEIGKIVTSLESVFSESASFAMTNQTMFLRQLPTTS